MARDSVINARILVDGGRTRGWCFSSFEHAWTQVILLTSACTGLTATIALVEPIASFFASCSQLLGKVLR